MFFNAQKLVGLELTASRLRDVSYGLSFLTGSTLVVLKEMYENNWRFSNGFGGAEGLREATHGFFFRNALGDAFVNLLTLEEGGEESLGECMDGDGFLHLMASSGLISSDPCPSPLTVSPVELELRLRNELACLLGYADTLEEAAELEYAVGEFIAAVAVRHAAEEAEAHARAQKRNLTA